VGSQVTSTGFAKPLFNHGGRKNLKPGLANACYGFELVLSVSLKSALLARYIKKNSNWWTGIWAVAQCWLKGYLRNA
jgi:hypothetical protein